MDERVGLGQSNRQEWFVHHYQDMNVGEFNKAMAKYTLSRQQPTGKSSFIVFPHKHAFNGYLSMSLLRTIADTRRGHAH